jgi:hypothetical protein
MRELVPQTAGWYARHGRKHGTSQNHHFGAPADVGRDPRSLPCRQAPSRSPPLGPGSGSVHRVARPHAVPVRAPSPRAGSVDAEGRRPGPKRPVKQRGNLGRNMASGQDAHRDPLPRRRQRARSPDGGVSRRSLARCDRRRPPVATEPGQREPTPRRRAQFDRRSSRLALLPSCSPGGHRASEPRTGPSPTCARPQEHNLWESVPATWRSARPLPPLRPSAGGGVERQRHRAPGWAPGPGRARPHPRPPGRKVEPAPFLRAGAHALGQPSRRPCAGASTSRRGERARSGSAGGAGGRGRSARGPLPPRERPVRCRTARVRWARDATSDPPTYSEARKAKSSARREGGSWR